MTKYTITMSNGIVLDDLTMNGSMYVSQNEVTEEMLNEDALSEIVIVETEDGVSSTTTYGNMLCDGILHWPEGWLFNLRAMSDQELEHRQMEARLEEQEAALIELAAMIGGEM